MELKFNSDRMIHSKYRIPFIFCQTEKNNRRQ